MIALVASAWAGGACSGSCAMSGADHAWLPTDEALALIDAWQAPLGATDEGLEALLFHADALHPHDLDVLEPERRAWLEAELQRTLVQVEMTLVDDAGEVRGTLSSAPFPLKEKQHLHLEGTGSLADVEAGGRVWRVGLEHLWSRW